MELRKRSGLACVERPEKERGRLRTYILTLGIRKGEFSLLVRFKYIYACLIGQDYNGTEHGNLEWLQRPKKDLCLEHSFS